MACCLLTLSGFLGKPAPGLPHQPHRHWTGHWIPHGRGVSVQLHQEEIQNSVPQPLWTQEGEWMIFTCISIPPFTLTPIWEFLMSLIKRPIAMKMSFIIKLFLIRAKWIIWAYHVWEQNVNQTLCTRGQTSPADARSKLACTCKFC